MYDVFVPMPGVLGERVLAVLVGSEEAGVCGARARHHCRHAADRPADTFYNKNTLKPNFSN